MNSKNYKTQFQFIILNLKLINRHMFNGFFYRDNLGIRQSSKSLWIFNKARNGAMT